MRAALALLTCLAAGALGRAQTPPRDAPRLATIGSATLTGVVVADDDTKAPLRRATITLSRAGLEDIRTTLTDDQGRFVYGELPAGAYTLLAAKAGYVTTNYGALQPGMPGTSISLVDGQRFEAKPTALMRGAVIAGRLLDRNGQPARGTAVLARSIIVVNGERRRREPSEVGTSSNAHGDYRIYGLPPGEYVVYADSQSAQNERPTLPADLAWAQHPAGQAPPSGRAFTYASTYFPGTVDNAAAASITVGKGEERAGVDFSVQYVPVSRVTGIVTGADGSPAEGVSVWRAPKRPDALFSTAFFNTRTGPGGVFTFTNVPPGEFVLLSGGAPSVDVTTNPGVRDARAFSARTEWGTTEFSESGQDVGELRIRLQPGTSVAGWVTVQMASQAPPPDLTRIGLLLFPAGPVNTIPGAPSATLKADGTFRFDGVMPGRFRLTRTGSASTNGWAVRSAILGGQDLMDAPLDVLPGADVTGIVVTLSDRMAGLSGTLVDETGRPTPQFYVFMFPVDRAYWTNGSRRVASVRADVNGVYTIGGLPAGEYYVCASTELDRIQQYDTRYLEQFVPSAIKITLGEGEQRTQSLRIGG